MEAVERSPADALLLSGGLDTSVLAWVGARRGVREAFSVLVGDRPPDEEHAEAVARARGLSWHPLRVTLEELLAEVPFVVRVMRTFDPMEVRNSIVIARALHELQQEGLTSTMTGDAADELFGGYSFLWGKGQDEFRASRDRMSSSMRFSSTPMGQELGVRVSAPYTDPSVIDFARSLEKSDLVVEVEGVVHGKFLLRLAFPEVENRWRRKDPIEVGSGSTSLPAYFRARADPSEFARERREVRRTSGVAIRDPEQLAYYRVFREVFGDSPPIPRGGADPCPHCGFELPTPEGDFCFTCGAYPARTPPASLP